MVRKSILALAAAASVLSASAEGYQVNTLSARQLGMGHTGTGQHLGGESMFFNPAGLGFLDKQVEVGGSFTGIFATAKATLADGMTYKTANDPSTPIMVNAAFSINDNLKAGLSFYTPYGSGINWTDNWPGAIMSQSVSLKVFTLQPTFSWRISDRVSVGAGLTISWGSVNLHKGLVVPSTADIMLGALASAGLLTDPLYYNGVMPASIALEGKSSVACGVNVGVMYDITDRLTVGASFRSKVKMSVDAGLAAINYSDIQAEQLLAELNVLNSTNFAASMPCPYVFSMGLSWKPASRLTLAADARLTGWNAYKSLDISFLDDRCAAYNQHIEKNYRNCWSVSVGGEYAVTGRFDARIGLMVDTSPISHTHYNPETPGMTKLEPTLGFTFRPLENFSIDCGMMYVAGLGVNGASCSYPDLLAAKINQNFGTSLPMTGTFTADYKVHAFIPSIGLRYAF
ncbi:MAG: outer membrane protein transport protein [Muribaculaceae bacterium]|nr:outer membrane protein transport protein [Muribaculaceae bacterium]